MGNDSSGGPTVGEGLRHTPLRPRVSVRYDTYRPDGKVVGMGMVDVPVPTLEEYEDLLGRVEELERRLSTIDSRTGRIN